MLPKISVIVPVYNVQQYLKRCINSILSQSFTNFELILIDDGSTDDSGKICDEYANKDTRIIVHHKINGGLSSARNVGINIAKGEYIGFVDSDDYINYKMYEILYNNAMKSDSDISSCDYRMCDSTQDINTFESVDIMHSKEILFNNRDALVSLLTFDKEIGICVWDKIYKKTLFEKVKFIEGILYEDEAFSPHIFQLSKKTIYINAKLYYYFQSPISLTRGIGFREKQFDSITIFEERIKFFRKLNDKYLYQLSENRYFYHLFYLYKCASGDSVLHKQFIKELQKSIRKNIYGLFTNPYYSRKDWLDYIMFAYFLPGYKMIKLKK